MPLWAFKGVCCLNPSPVGVRGQARKPQCRGDPSPFTGCSFHMEASTSMLWLRCSCVCACSHTSLTLSLTHRLTPCLHYKLGLSPRTRWHLSRLWLTLVTDSRPDLHPQLLVHVPHCPWVRGSILASWPCPLATSLPALAKVLALTTPLNTDFLQTRIPALVNF